ncbi:hypothetical protein ACFFSO_29255, partial [Amorphoplanes nipponensis]
AAGPAPEASDGSAPAGASAGPSPAPAAGELHPVTVDLGDRVAAPAGAAPWTDPAADERAPAGEDVPRPADQDRDDDARREEGGERREPGLDTTAILELPPPE